MSPITTVGEDLLRKAYKAHMAKGGFTVIDEKEEMAIDKLVWVDIETTGLDPLTDEVLEIALAVTPVDKLNHDELEIMANAWVINPGHIEDIEIDDTVLDMHTENGLWDEVAASDLRPFQVDQAAVRWLEQQGVEAGTSPMCGSTVHFDRKFLAAHHPQLEDFFHYRNLDVSSFKVVYNIWGKEPYKPTPNKHHRGMSDIRESIDEFLFYKEKMLLSSTLAMDAWNRYTSPKNEPLPGLTSLEASWREDPPRSRMVTDDGGVYWGCENCRRQGRGFWHPEGVVACPHS